MAIRMLQYLRLRAFGATRVLIAGLTLSPLVPGSSYAEPTVPAPTVRPTPAAPIGGQAATDLASVADNRVATSIVDNCNTKLGDENCYYDNEDNRETLANAVTQSLTAKGFVVISADQNPSRTLTVTVTGIGYIPATCLMLCGVVATATADYQMTNAGGKVVLNGTLGSKADEDTDAGLEQLADQIATAVAKSTQGGSLPTTPAMPTGEGGQPSGTPGTAD